MIVVSVMYPATDGSRFDEAYYLEHHAALLHRLWDGMGLREARFLKGMSAPGGGAPPYQVLALLTFESADAFKAASRAHGAEIFADIPKFTDVQPLVQINAVMG